MSNQRFASVWDAIEDTPAEAENMRLRSVLITALKNHITRTEMSQSQAAKLFGVTQPRISDLRRGKINLHGLNALVDMAAASGDQLEGMPYLRTSMVCSSCSTISSAWFTRSGSINRVSSAH